jgi:hypothetical protein
MNDLMTRPNLLHTSVIENSAFNLEKLDTISELKLQGVLRKYKNFFERYSKKLFILENLTLKYGKVNGKGPFKEVNLKGARVVTDRKSRRKFTIVTYNK